MDCPKCRYALSPFEKVCPRCVQMQTAQTATAVAHAAHPIPMQYYPPQALACTACGNPAIQKVSGLYRGGVWSAEATGVGVGYGRTSNGQSFTTVSTSHAVSAGGTGLAQALAPPMKPHRFQTKAENILIGTTFVTFLLWLVGTLIFVSDPVSPSVLIPYIAVASAMTIAAVAAIPSALRSARENKASTAVLVQRWQAVMSHWDQLYYCARCDRACNPQTGQHAPSRAVSGILYQDILSGTNTL